MASIGNSDFTQQMLGIDVFELGIGIANRRRGLLCIDLNVAPPEEELGEENGEEKDKSLSETETAHCWDGEKSVADSDGEIVENEKRIRRWNAILGIAEDASVEYEKSQNQRRKIVHIKEPQPKKKQPSPQIQRFESNSGYQNSVPPPPRSTRGRTVTIPNKYRDSVPPEATFFGRNRNEKPAAAVVQSSKRRSR